MNPSIMAQLDGFARRLLPAAITLLMVLLQTVLVPVSVVAPALTLVAVYYWTLYRPDLMPPAAVFAAGVLLDAVSGGLLGVSPLVLLLVYSLALTQRRFLLGRTFPAVWLGFLATAAIAATLHWLLQSTLHGLAIDPRRALAQALLTTLIYPLFAWLLGWTHRLLVREPAQ